MSLAQLQPQLVIPYHSNDAPAFSRAISEKNLCYFFCWTLSFHRLVFHIENTYLFQGDPAVCQGHHFHQACGLVTTHVVPKYYATLPHLQSGQCLELGLEHHLEDQEHGPEDARWSTIVYLISVARGSCVLVTQSYSCKPRRGIWTGHLKLLRKEYSTALRTDHPFH